MTLSRTRRSTPTVLLALLLVLVLAVQRPAQALAPGGVVLAPSAASALGFGTAASATGAAAAGGIALVGGAIVLAAGAGLLIGWGLVEAAEWAWADGEDPLEPTTTGGGFAMTNDEEAINSTAPSVALVGGVDEVTGSGSYFFSDFPDEDGYTLGFRVYCSANPDGTGSSGTVTANISNAGSGVEHTRTLACSASWPHAYRWTVSTNRSGYGWDDYDLLQPVQGGELVEDRQLVTEIECTDPADGSTTVHQETSALYAPGSEPLTPGVVCPAGTYVSDLTVSRTIDGGDGSDDETLFDATPVVPLTGTQYDDCTDGSCSLVLERIRADGTTESCFDSDVLCVGWITDPARTENYRCVWGTHVMPLDDCEMFHAIDTDAQTGTATQPDGSVDSDLGTTNDVGTTPTTEAEAQAGCSPWAWINPFSGGIAQGVACALEWAAVPDTAVVNQQLQELDTHVMTKVPFAYADLVGPVVTELPATVSGACAGNLWDLTPGDTRPGYDSVKELHGPGQLAVPCTPPTWWQPVDALLTSMVVVATAWGLWNLVGVAVGGPRDGDGEGVG